MNSAVTQTARGTPFDNTSNGFTSTDVQGAIEEATHLLSDAETIATANATTTSGTDALITGMTITPAAGNYIVWFSSSVISNNAGAIITVSLYINGVQKADSVRTLAPFDGGALSALTARCGVSIQGLATVNGSQTIEVRWNTSGGTATCGPRNLLILRAG